MQPNQRTWHHLMRRQVVPGNRWHRCWFNYAVFNLCLWRRKLFPIRGFFILLYCGFIVED